MGVFNRRKPAPEARAVDTVPWNYGGGNSMQVTEASALGLVPVFAAIRLISDSISTLPLQAFRKAGDERIPVTAPSLIRSPSPRGTLGDWLGKLAVSLLIHGNAYGLVTTRDGMGFVTGIEWLDPNQVTVDESNPLTPRYFYAARVLSDDEIVHLTWITAPGSVCGLSPLEAARTTISTGIGAGQYGRDWFANGGVPPGTFKNSGRIVTDEESQAIKSRLVASIKKGQPLVYGSDWDYNAIAIPPEQSQFIQTHRLTATQIATIYGIPPVMIGGELGGSMTYSTVEQQSLDFVTHTLRPWLVRIEDALSALLPNATFLKFNADALIRTDSKTKYEIYALQRQIGLRNIDELRALEDLPPLPDGQGQEYLPRKPDPIAVKVEPNEKPAPEEGDPK